MEFVLLINVLLMVDELVEMVVSPPTLALFNASQEKVEAIYEDNTIFSWSPEQMA